MGKPKENSSKQEEKNEIWSDPRFSHLVSDPRFKNLPKSERKVKIDKRFESMFNDKKFKVKYTVDKYGRKVNKSSSEDLKKYYDIGSSDDEEEEAKEKQEEEKQITKDDNELDVDENDALESDGEVVPTTLKERLLDPNIDYARGEGRLISDSSSDDESSEDEDDELFIEHVWGELDHDAETTEESTKRLAVCNMDWDRIRASDIMMVCSSFLPPGGSILSVTIYPSEFGKQRMAEEEKHGPPELTKKNNDEDNSNSDTDEELVKEQDSDAEEGDDYHMEKLRQYQLNRLKYYYAVIVCDSVETADKIYQECDGIEYESSATKVDLRFIPDDTSFDDDEPHDVCTELPEVGQYKPRNFTTTALQQATVDLTWDETSLERREVGDKLLSGKMSEVSDAELRKFVAYSSEEEEEEVEEEEDDEDNAHEKIEKVDQKEEKSSKTEKAQPTTDKKKKTKKEDPISKYKALLQEITEKEEKAKKSKFEMEFSWDVAAEEKSTEKSEEKTKPLTVIEKVLQKRSEKNKRRKEERKKKKKQMNGSEGDDAALDSDESDDHPDDIDMNDPYFAEEFANGDFEPPKSKKKDKNKKKSKQTDSVDEEEERQAKELELLMDDDDEDDKKQHFSLEKIIETENETKSKKKRRKQLKKSKGEINSAKKEVDDNFEVNVEDDRFKAIFSSHHFNIDPTDSHFKKTKGMEQIIHEKLKRRHGNEDKKNAAAIFEDETQSKRPKKLIENSLLVKSLKRKLQQQGNGRK